MKHLPFDLAKAQTGHPLITRDGKNARYVTFNERISKEYPVIAEVGSLKNLFSKDGEAKIHRSSGSDLFLAVEEPQGEGGCCGGCPLGRPGEPGPTGPTGPPSLDEFRETYIQVPLSTLKEWVEMADCAMCPGIVWKGSQRQAKEDAEDRRLELINQLHTSIKTIIDRIS